MADSWGIDGLQNNPPSFDAACKAQLGWTDPIDLVAIANANGGLTFEKMFTIPSQPTTVSYKIPVAEDEYFIIENRQPTGTDKFLLGKYFFF